MPGRRGVQLGEDLLAPGVVGIQVLRDLEGLDGVVGLLEPPAPLLRLPPKRKRCGLAGKQCHKSLNAAPIIAPESEMNHYDSIPARLRSQSGRDARFEIELMLRPRRSPADVELDPGLSDRRKTPAVRRRVVWPFQNSGWR